MPGAISDAVIRDIVRLRKRKRLSSQAIAAELGHAVPTVQKYLRREAAGVTARRKKQPKRLTAAGLERLRRDWEQGVPVAAIVAWTGLSDAGVRYRCKSLGFQRTPYEKGSLEAWKPTPAQEQWLRDHWLSRTKIWEMEAHLGVSVTAIHRRARLLGLPTRTTKALLAVRYPDSLLATKDKALVRARNGGAENGDIAAYFGMTAVQVRARFVRIKKRGIAFGQQRHKFAITPEVDRVIRDGLRLGVMKKTIARIVGAPSLKTITKYTTTHRLVSRNRKPQTLKILAPESLATFHRAGNPVDLVQKLYRASRVLTEAWALRALRDYRDAVERYPEIVEYREPVRRHFVKTFLREPSPAIEALRSQFEKDDHAEMDRRSG